MRRDSVRQAISRVRLSLILGAALPALLLPGLLMSAPLSAAESHCEPYLVTPSAHPFGYRMRGDRCEGIYVREVASATLLVASLTESFENYDLSLGKDLLVEWTTLGDGSFRLRALGLKRRLYYRMDTVRPPSVTSYTWPSNILTALSIPRKNIGVIGWTQYTVGETKRNVYVPLRVSQQKDPMRRGTYQLVLLPGRELKEVFVSMATVGTDGHPKAFLRDGEALEYGYYPAERGIVIPISDVEAPGIYYLEIGAILRSGEATAVELWFYHPGE